MPAVTVISKLVASESCGLLVAMTEPDELRISASTLRLAPTLAGVIAATICDAVKNRNRSTSSLRSITPVMSAPTYSVAVPISFPWSSGRYPKPFPGLVVMICRSSWSGLVASP